MAGTAADITVSQTLPLLSYNSMGWSDHKTNFIRSLLLAHGVMVCAIQEHFLLKHNLYKLACFDGFEVFSVPAHKNSSIVCGGRPSGGLSLFYSQDLSKFATRLSVPNSFRVQGLKIDMPNCTFLFINAYFPNDPGNNNLDDINLLNTLQDIKFLTDQVDDSCMVVIMGDLNTDFSRNTPFVQIVKRFFQENNMVSAWSKFDCDFTFYHERVTGGRTVVSKSKIDHFGVKAEDLSFCGEAKPLHLVDNFSYHVPIYMNIIGKDLAQNVSKNGVSVDYPKKPLWYKATDANLVSYAQDLSDLVNNTYIDTDVLCCRNAHCSNADHITKLDDMCHGLFSCISSAVRDNIPMGNNSAANNIPGWNDSVKPLKEDSQFWKAIWESAGRPVDTELHRVYKNCRNKYMYAIRKVKRLEMNLRKNKFLNACLNNEVSDILKEIKTMRAPSSKSANVIDGHSNSADISNHFQKMYKDIYNTHRDRDELDNFLRENNNKINQNDIDLVEKITPEMVKNIITDFSNNKNDSMFDWKSNALKVGVESLADPICDLLRSLIIHGHIPQIFLLCSLVPIVKNMNESKLSSNNYRLIAISALILKIFDHILIILSAPNLKPSIFQYGFQKGKSTGMCTWTLTETINYFRNRHTPVFLCLMDLTKAFDLVKLSILFNKLAQKVSPILIRFLAFSYIHQECVVSWGGVQSTAFTISNGVRQGAVLSPTLFNIYIDSLFDELRLSGFGCKIQNQYFGCIGYADDIALVAPSREALQMMINISKSFFDRHGIKISTNPDVNKTKTKVLVFGKKNNLASLLLGDKPLPFVNQWKHLGHTIHTDESPAHDMLLRVNELVGKLQSLRQEFPGQDPRVMLKLIQTYLLSLYGGQMWDIYSTAANKLSTVWHQIIKWEFKLPYATHRYLLHDVSKCIHIKHRVIKSFINFHQKIQSCDNPNIRLLYSLQCGDMRSTFGRNIRNICRDAGVTSINLVNPSEISINPVPAAEAWRVPLLLDLLDARDINQGFLNEEELKQMMNQVCCD